MRRAFRMLVVLSSGVVAAVAAGQSAPADEWAVPELKFEVLDTPVPMGAPPGIQYVAEFDVPPADDLTWSSPRLVGQTVPRWEPAAERIMETTVAGQHLSVEQRTALRTMRSPRYSPWLQREERAGATRLLVLAAKEEDARLLVRAVIEDLNRSRRDRLEKPAEELAELRATVATQTENVAKVTQRVADVEAAQRALVEQTGYRDTDQASRDLHELERVVRLADVDITGIRAKLAAIRKAREEGGSSETRVQVLDRLQLEQDIELAGALARKAAAEKQATDARQYLDNQQRLEKDKEWLGQARGFLPRNNRRIEELTALLASPPADLRPVQVVDHRVTIRPVKPSGESSPRPASPTASAPSADR